MTTRESEIIGLIKKEVKPALGSTEPIAVALAVATAMEILEDKCTALITLTEGKFHEIKRLCYACRQKEVTYLKRLTFGGIVLDENLEEGEWRNLTDEEIAILRQN